MENGDYGEYEIKGSINDMRLFSSGKGSSVMWTGFTVLKASVGSRAAKGNRAKTIMV